MSECYTNAASSTTLDMIAGGTYYRETTDSDTIEIDDGTFTIGVPRVSVVRQPAVVGAIVGLVAVALPMPLRLLDTFAPPPQRRSTRPPAMNVGRVVQDRHNGPSRRKGKR